MLQKFHFYRFEFKYVVPKKYKDFIRDDLLKHMRWDEYALLEKEKKYLVNSLYFDSYNLMSYYDKIDGIDNRCKLRLRVYNTLDFTKSDNIFFEIKNKINSVIIKDRGCFSSRNYQYFIENNYPKKIFNSPFLKEKAVLEKFLALKNRYRLKPFIYITYDREPFEGIIYKNLRVTFDSNIKVSKAKFFLDNNLAKAINYSFMDDCSLVFNKNFILELKYKGFIPSWFHHLIKRYQMQQIAFSKYCLGTYRLALGSML